METKVVRRVRTLAGVRKYDQPIGSIIKPDVVPTNIPKVTLHDFRNDDRQEYEAIDYGWFRDTYLRSLFGPEQKNYPQLRTYNPVINGGLKVKPRGFHEGPPVYVVYEQDPELLRQFGPGFAPWKATEKTEPIKVVYRGMSLKEWDEAQERGYFKSNESGVILEGWEGTNASDNPDTASYYLPRNGDSIVVAFEVNPEDEWFTSNADNYLRTRARIPLSRIKGHSHIITMREGHPTALSGLAKPMPSEEQGKWPEQSGPDLMAVNAGQYTYDTPEQAELAGLRSNEHLTPLSAKGSYKGADGKLYRVTRDDNGLWRLGVRAKRGQLFSPVGGYFNSEAAALRWANDLVAINIREAEYEAEQQRLRDLPDPRFGGLTKSQYDNMVRTWQTWEGSRHMKNQIRDYLKMHNPESDYPWPLEMPAGGPWQRRGDTGMTIPQFLAMVNNSPRKTVYRGMRLSTVKFNRMIRAGYFDEPMGSCTTNRSLAELFSGGLGRGAKEREKGVLLILTNAPAHEFDQEELVDVLFDPQNGLRVLASGKEEYRKKAEEYAEHLTTGHFRVSVVQDKTITVPDHLLGMFPVEEKIKVVYASYEGPLKPGEEKSMQSFGYNPDLDLELDEEPTTWALLDSHILDENPSPEEGKSMEDKARRVRTASGSRRYGQPIGSVIVRDVIPKVPGGGKTPSTPKGSKPTDKVDMFDTNSIVKETARVFKNIKVKGTPDGSGTEDDPIFCGKDLNKAVDLLEQGKHIRLAQPDEVTILLDKLVARVNSAVRKGDKAPNYNLCLISVPNTNLFCHGNKGKSRITMPQLSAVPVPGSPAEKLPQKGHGTGEVMGEEAFKAALIASGISVTPGRAKASHLRATQNELVGPTVAGIAGAMKKGDNPVLEAPIFVTRDNYILDGHHRWAAKVAIDAEDGKLGDIEMNVEVIDADIGAILDFTNAFCELVGLKPRGFDNSQLAEVKAALLRIQTKVVESDMEDDPRETVGSEFLKELFAALPESEDIEEVEMKWLFDSIPVFLLDLECKIGPQSPDPRAARLRKYWSVGVGGATKIKWGVPGDGKRCIRHLRKYLGPRVAGYCQNLHQQMLGGTVMGKGPGESKSIAEMTPEEYEQWTEFDTDTKELEEDTETKKEFSTERRDELAKEVTLSLIPYDEFYEKHAATHPERKAALSHLREVEGTDGVFTPQGDWQPADRVPSLRAGQGREVGNRASGAVQDHEAKESPTAEVWNYTGAIRCDVCQSKWPVLALSSAGTKSDAASGSLSQDGTGTGAPLHTLQLSIGVGGGDWASGCDRLPEVKKLFSTDRREQLAKRGLALKDGSFPIENEQDLRNAIHAFGRAKDKERAKRHIIKRARALKLERLLPEAWDEKWVSIDLESKDIREALDNPFEVKRAKIRHVRTAAGAKFYGQPIGSVIVADTLGRISKTFDFIREVGQGKDSSVYEGQNSQKFTVRRAPNSYQVFGSDNEVEYTSADEMAVLDYINRNGRPGAYGRTYVRGPAARREQNVRDERVHRAAQEQERANSKLTDSQLAELVQKTRGTPDHEQYLREFRRRKG